MSISYRRLLLGGPMSVCALAAASTGLSCGVESVTAHVEVVETTKNALSAAAITSITGTYGGLCSGRASDGTDGWLFVGSGSGTTDVSVVKNDSDCVLTVRNIVTADGVFIGTPAIALDATDTYPASASAFALSGGPPAFYGNTKISALTFAADFTISIRVSDAPNASDAGDRAAAFAIQSASVTVATVPASNYTLSLAAFDIAKDASNIVQSVSGYAELTAGTVVGQDYAIYEGQLTGASTLVDVVAAYVLATEKHTLASLSPALEIPASQFGLGGVTLTGGVKRTVIVRNTSVGVTSYQLLLVNFTP